MPDEFLALLFGLALVHARKYRRGEVQLLWPVEEHSIPVDKRQPRSAGSLRGEIDKSHRSSLPKADDQPVRPDPGDGGALDPINRQQLASAFVDRYLEDIASEVAGEDADDALARSALEAKNCEVGAVLCDTGVAIQHEKRIGQREAAHAPRRGGCGRQR